MGSTNVSLFKQDMEEVNMVSTNKWKPSNLYKVNHFSTYDLNEKQIVFDYLRSDIQLVEKYHIKLNDQIKVLND